MTQSEQSEKTEQRAEASQVGNGLDVEAIASTWTKQGPRLGAGEAGDQLAGSSANTADPSKLERIRQERERFLKEVQPLMTQTTGDPQTEYGKRFMEHQERLRQILIETPEQASLPAAVKGSAIQQEQDRYIADVQALFTRGGPDPEQVKVEYTRRTTEYQEKIQQFNTQSTETSHPIDSPKATSGPTGLQTSSNARLEGNLAKEGSLPPSNTKINAALPSAVLLSQVTGDKIDGPSRVTVEDLGKLTPAQNGRFAEKVALPSKDGAAPPQFQGIDLDRLTHNNRQADLAGQIGAIPNSRADYHDTITGAAMLHSEREVVIPKEPSTRRRKNDEELEDWFVRPHYAVGPGTESPKQEEGKNHLYQPRVVADNKVSLDKISSGNDQSTIIEVPQVFNSRDAKSQTPTVGTAPRDRMSLPTLVLQRSGTDEFTPSNPTEGDTACKPGTSKVASPTQYAAAQPNTDKATSPAGNPAEVCHPLAEPISTTSGARQPIKIPNDNGSLIQQSTRSVIESTGQTRHPGKLSSDNVSQTQLPPKATIDSAGQSCLPPKLVGDASGHVRAPIKFTGDVAVSVQQPIKFVGDIPNTIKSTGTIDVLGGRISISLIGDYTTAGANQIREWRPDGEKGCGKRYLTGAEIVAAALIAAAGAARVRQEHTIAAPQSIREPSAKYPVLRRPSHIIALRDDLVSLAEQLFHDARLAWLIVDLNQPNMKVNWDNDTCVVELSSRQEIQLPVWQDIVDFHSQHQDIPNPEKLVTVVSEQQLDRELLDLGLAKAVGLSDPRPTVVAAIPPYSALPVFNYSAVGVAALPRHTTIPALQFLQKAGCELRSFIARIPHAAVNSFLGGPNL